jgi:hypothetical protein
MTPSVKAHVMYYGKTMLSISTVEDLLYKYRVIIEGRVGVPDMQVEDRIRLRYPETTYARQY